MGLLDLFIKNINDKKDIDDGLINEEREHLNEGYDSYHFEEDEKEDDDYYYEDES